MDTISKDEFKGQKHETTIIEAGTHDGKCKKIVLMFYFDDETALYKVLVDKLQVDTFAHLDKAIDEFNRY